MTNQPEPARLLRDAERYLSALHGSVARHDNLAANYGCAGCELRDRIAAALPAVSAVAPATDQAALRERIITALNNAHHTHPCPALGDEIWSGCVHYDEAGRVAGVGSCHSGRRADAVLAVLPASVDRAAELSEADRQFLTFALDLAADRMVSDDGFTDEDEAALEKLRRMAAESVPAVAGPTGDETQDEAHLPFIHVDDDGDRLDIGAVMASTYDGEAPVVYVAAEQHQGDTVATVYVRPDRVDEVIAALRSARLAAETLPAGGAQQPKEA